MLTQTHTAKQFYELGSQQAQEKNFPEAVKWFEKAADLGYAPALLSLGLCFENGDGVLQNNLKAVHFYALAADQGDRVAQYHLAVCYENGNGVEQNDEKAWRSYQLSADQGYANAQYALAVCYQSGKLVKNDNEKAVHYYTLAANQGHGEAQEQLSYCYEVGQGVAVDLGEASKWSKAAEKQIKVVKKSFVLTQYEASQGDADALTRMGHNFVNGFWVNQNYARALECYQLAAEKGCIWATASLAECYEEGIVTQKNLALASKWMKEARKQGLGGTGSLELELFDANQGDAGAQYRLGSYYGNGGNGVEISYEKAVHYYSLAANQGHGYAQGELSRYYEHGVGVAKDLVKALKWYKEAEKNGFTVRKSFTLLQVEADQGEADAQFNLGFCYDEGKGVEEDAKKAVSYYKLAAAQGHANAQCNLGICYEEGNGVKADAKKAVSYYKLAAAQGHADAQYNLGLCHDEGNGVEADMEQAVGYYKLAAVQGNATAQLSLGYCYEDGDGVEEDMEQAVYYYQLAAKQGNADALFNLARCYLYGEGVKPNPERAIFNYELAADQGNINALNCLNELFTEGVNKNENKASAYEIERWIIIDPINFAMKIKNNFQKNPTEISLTIQNYLRNKRIIAALHKNQDCLEILVSCLFERATQLKNTSDSEFNQAIEFFNVIPETSIFYPFALDHLALLKTESLTMIEDEVLKNTLKQEISAIRDKIISIIQNYFPIEFAFNTPPWIVVHSNTIHLTNLQKQLLDAKNLSLESLHKMNRLIVYEALIPNKNKKGSSTFYGENRDLLFRPSVNSEGEKHELNRQTEQQDTLGEKVNQDNASPSI